MSGSSSRADLVRLLDAALARRAALLADPQTTACRLFNSAADGLDGLVIERYGPVLVAQLHAGRLQPAEEAVRELCAECAAHVGARAVYRKVFPPDRSALLADLDQAHRDPAPWIGEPSEPELAVRENGKTFLVHPYDGFATGLFLDHRVQRAHVRAAAAGQRVLNTFAYTCGFTVAAALGGAASVVSVDVSRKYLEWGKRNLAANGLDLTPHRFICSDIFEYYQRAGRQRHEFDYIVLDPPTFGRAKRPQRTFALRTDLARLIGGALGLLAPGGQLQLSVNHRETSVQRLAEAVSAAAGGQGRRCVLIEPPAVPLDFAGDAAAAKCVLARAE